MKVQLERFLREEDGATAIEYGLIAGLIAIMIIGGATLTGTKLESVFNAIAAALPEISAPAATQPPAQETP